MNCDRCGQALEGKRSSKRFCSGRCRMALWRDNNDPRQETFTFAFRAHRLDLGDLLFAKGRVPEHLRHDKKAINDVLLEMLLESLQSRH